MQVSLREGGREGGREGSKRYSRHDFKGRPGGRDGGPGGGLTSMAGEEKTGRWLLLGKMAVWGMISSRGLSRAW